MLARLQVCLLLCGFFPSWVSVFSGPHGGVQSCFLWVLSKYLPSPLLPRLPLPLLPNPLLTLY